MHWRVSYSLVKLQTCCCSHTCYSRLLQYQRQILPAISRGVVMPTRTHHFRCFSSKSLQYPKNHYVLHPRLSLPYLSSTSQSLLQIIAAAVSGPRCVHHRHQSQYVAEVRYLEKLKESDEFCEEAMRTGQFTVFYDLRALVKGDDASKGMMLVWRSADEMKDVLSLFDGLDLTDAVLLNSTSKDPSLPAKFALNIPKVDETTQQSLERVMDAETLGIRRALFTLGRGHIHEFVQAYALLQWHCLQTFCSKCGAKNKKNMSGSRRICTSCSEVYYPTMKPIVITLVTNGDRCLVARQPQFPPGMYSALSGFCDMGETVEDAVRREVAEEVGLEVSDIKYYSSQHWPIPSSGLMLGCYASVKADDEILIDKNELEDARWVTREEVKDILPMSPGQSLPWFPPRRAIAHHLLAGWAAEK